MKFHDVKNNKTMTFNYNVYTRQACNFVFPVVGMQRPRPTDIEVDL